MRRSPHLSRKQHKTRYSDRAATEEQTKAAEKVAKVEAEGCCSSLPSPLLERALRRRRRTAPLGLSGDTATKKKKKKVKGAPKERIQEKAPAPPAPKPEATADPA